MNIEDKIDMYLVNEGGKSSKLSYAFQDNKSLDTTNVEFHDSILDALSYYRKWMKHSSAKTENTNPTDIGVLVKDGDTIYLRHIDNLAIETIAKFLITKVIKFWDAPKSVINYLDGNNGSRAQANKESRFAWNAKVHKFDSEYQVSSAVWELSKFSKVTLPTLFDVMNGCYYADRSLKTIIDHTFVSFITARIQSGGKVLSKS